MLEKFYYIWKSKMFWFDYLEISNLIVEKLRFYGQKICERIVEKLIRLSRSSVSFRLSNIILKKVLISMSDNQCLSSIQFFDWLFQFDWLLKALTFWFKIFDLTVNEILIWLLNNIRFHIWKCSDSIVEKDFIWLTNYSDLIFEKLRFDCQRKLKLNVENVLLRLFKNFGLNSY